MRRTTCCRVERSLPMEILFIEPRLPSSLEDLSMDMLGSNGWRKFPRIFYYIIARKREIIPVPNPWERISFFLRQEMRGWVSFFFFWKISSEFFKDGWRERERERESRGFFDSRRPMRQRGRGDHNVATSRIDAILNRIRQLIRSKIYAERLNGDSFCLFAFTLLFVYVSLLFVFVPSAYVSTHRVFRTPNSLTPF